MSLSNFIILGVLKTFLVLQLIEKAYSISCNYYPLYPTSNTPSITTCTYYCCGGYPTTSSGACCTYYYEYYSSGTSFSFPLWIIGVIIGGIILLVVVIIIIIIVIKKHKNKNQLKIADGATVSTVPTQKQQQPPVIQPYSTGYNNYLNPNSNPYLNTNSTNSNSKLNPNADSTLPLPLKTNNEFMY